MNITIESFHPKVAEKKIDLLLLKRAFLVHQSVPEFVSSGAPPTTEEELRQRLNGKRDATLFIAEMHDSQTTQLIDVGYLLAYKHPKSKFGDKAMYLDLVGVTPEFRKYGVFKTMEDELATWAKEKGYQSILVKTWRVREAMQAALTKLGYKQTEVQPRQNPQEDRLLYEKEL